MVATVRVGLRVAKADFGVQNPSLPSFNSWAVGFSGFSGFVMVFYMITVLQEIQNEL